MLTKLDLFFKSDFPAGRLTFSWNPNDLNSESVDDNTVIYNLVFKTVGNPGDETAVTFGDDPTPREISDADGNILIVNYINGKITIIDQVTIGGYLKTQKGDPIINAAVNLDGAIEKETVTDKLGWYSFDVEPNQEYNIKPSMDAIADQGVTTLDLVVMHWHILGKKYLMSNHDLIASDVNMSHSLTTLDLALTRGVILHRKDRFEGRNAVEFISYDYTGDPEIFSFNNYLNINPVVSELGLNFTAVKLGDAGRSWLPNKTSNGREMQLEEIELIMEPGEVTANKVIVPIQTLTFQNMVGMQFTLEWDPKVYHFEGFHNQALELQTNLENVESGKLTACWNSEEIEGMSLDQHTILSDLEFTVLNDNEPELAITSGVTPALAFDSELRSFGISGKKNLEVALTSSDISIYPNPARDIIRVMNVYDAEYTILSTTGIVIKTGNFAGSNEIGLENISKGVYILQLVNPDNVMINKKFIKL